MDFIDKQPEIKTASRTYRRMSLLNIYRRYARAMDWNTHPMLIERRVDVFFRLVAQLRDLRARVDQRTKDGFFANNFCVVRCRRRRLHGVH